MRFKMSADDFLKGQLCVVGWNPCQIVEAKETMSKGGINPNTGQEKDKVQMMNVTFKVTDGPSKGCLIYQNFPENIPSFMVDLMENGFGVAVDKKKGFEGDITPEKLKGQYVDVNVGRGSWNGRAKNEILGYKPYSGTGK